MNSYLFPHIGKVIASTGSRHFPKMLHDLIRAQLPVDAMYIRQMRVTPTRIEPTTSKEPTFVAETVFSEHSAINPSSDLPAAEPATTDAAQLHLTRRKNGYRYEITVYRSGESKHFSAQERSLLQDISPVLLPMLEKHYNALQSMIAPDILPARAQGLETLHLRFANRVQQLGLKLSNREMQVCVGLLAGHTAPELAEQLQLKVNTVESYIKRAAIKLDISGRHSLMRWMYSPDDISSAAGSAKTTCANSSLAPNH